MSRKKNDHVLNWGWYGYNNFGDDLLQDVMFNVFKSCALQPVFPMKNTYASLEAEQIPRSYIQLFKRAKDCGALVVGPGGLFPYSNFLKLLIFYWVVRWWKIKNKKVIFFGIGISSSMSKMSKFLWRRIISSSDLFFTRSPEFLNVLGVQESKMIRTVPDVAFSLGSDISHERDTIEKSKIIAVSIANLCAPNDENGYNHEVKVWSEVCEKLISDGFYVELISFTQHVDERMAEDIIKSLRKGSVENRITHMLYSKISLAQEKWNQYRLVICSRFHSLVLSILSDVPAIPIAYGQKTEKLAKECGLREYLVFWNPAEKGYFGKLVFTDSTSILERVNMLLAREQSVRDYMSIVRKEKEKQALEAIEILSSVLKESDGE